MKMKTVLIIAAVLLRAMLFASCTSSKGYPMRRITRVHIDTGELLEVGWTSGGGMEGDRHSIVLTKDGPDAITTVSDTPDPRMPRRVCVYMTPTDTFDRLDALSHKYNFPAWNQLSKSDEQALDRPVSGFYLVFDNTSVSGPAHMTYEVGYGRMYPDGGREAVTEFIEVLKESISDDNMVDLYIQGEDDRMLHGSDGAAYMLLELLERTGEMDEGLVLMERDKDTVDGNLSYIFRWGTDSPDKFTAESWWAVAGDLSAIYEMDVLTGEYSRVLSY